MEYVSDAYIRLGSEEFGHHKYSARAIEVVKATNLPHIRGTQYFAIQQNRGLNIYLSPPAILGFLRHRVRASNAGVVPIHRGHTACEAIDGKLTDLNGMHGLLENSTSLIKGPVGAAKSILALHFLDGVSDSEVSLCVSLSDRVSMLLNAGRHFSLRHFVEDRVAVVNGWADLGSVTGNTKIVLYQLSPTYMVPGCLFSSNRSRSAAKEIL